jgi:holo-[acyl-carrier protein] synthase
MKSLDLRVGVDLVSVPHLAEMLATCGSAFVDMCWTNREQAYCNGSVERLAARWAAKEATMKAIGRGIGEIDPLEIEVISDEGHAPQLCLTGTALLYAGDAGLHTFALSLSHEADFAIAYVIGHNLSDDQPRPFANVAHAASPVQVLPHARIVDGRAVASTDNQQWRSRDGQQSSGPRGFGRQTRAS